MAKLVLLRLADRADESGICYPSQRRLAAECGITERTVRNAITHLICRGLVIIHTPSTPQGDTTRYRLTFANTPEPRSGGEPHSGEEQTAERRGTTFQREGNHVPVTPEPRSAKPSVNHQGTRKEPSVGSENRSKPECPSGAPISASALTTLPERKLPAAVARTLAPRPDKMTYQDRARWSEELRKIPAELSELNLVLNHRRKPNHKQRIADLQHRQAELKAWLDGRTGA
jgi:DNA-binding transcriptional MocR family regulator